MTWWRWTCLPLFLLTTASAPAGVSIPDVNNAGQVLATLNDWRAIMFGMMFLLVVSFVSILLLVWNNSRSSAAIAQAMTDAAVAKSRLADAVQTLNNNHGADRLTFARIEQVLAKIEAEW